MNDVNTVTHLSPHPVRLMLEHIEPFVHLENNLATGRFRNMFLNTGFQPIFSLAHRRTVGYEALLRAHELNSNPISPLAVFDMAQGEAENIFLDRLCRLVHARNFMAQANNSGWLFLNVAPSVTVNGNQHGAYFADLLERYQIPPHRVVIEILEEQIEDESLLIEAAEYYKSLGCLVAIDDFGAGHSNFDRIWRVQPHIVKLDRSIISQAASNSTVRRVIPNLVKLIHEAGSLVLMEGVETEKEALIAIDSDTDFVQGYYFARPSGTLPAEGTSLAIIDELHAISSQSTKQDYARCRDKITAYLNAFQLFVDQIKAGVAAAAACQCFLRLQKAERCYLLDRNGYQLGESVMSPHTSPCSDSRFLPLCDGSAAIWARRHYFQHAINEPGEIQISRPYLSIAGGNMCVTFSISIERNSETIVLCGDIMWSD